MISLPKTIIIIKTTKLQITMSAPFFAFMALKKGMETKDPSFLEIAAKTDIGNIIDVYETRLLNP